MSQNQEVPVSHDRSAPLAEGLSLLLADDDPVNRRITALLLTRRGHRVAVAADGIAALALAAEGRFDAVLLDLHMPGLDGFATAHRLRELGAKAGDGTPLPLVAVTSDDTEDSVARCRAAGFGEVLSKPAGPATLDALLARLTGQRAPQARPGADVRSQTVRGLLRIMGVPRLTELVAGFRQTATADGQAVAAALDRGDFEQMRDSAHRLRGQAAYLGLAGLQSLAAAIEEAAQQADRAHLDQLVPTLPAACDAAFAALNQQLCKHAASASACTA